MTQKKEVIKNENSIELFISQAIEHKVPVETMERLFALRKEFLAQKSKEEFDQAMSNFQGSCPVIEKTKSVPTRSGGKAYSYAPIESIVKQVQPLLTREKLSYAFKIENTEKGVKAICIVKHISGHTEQSEMEVPFGNKTEIMSNSQVTGAASTFAKRYAFCNAFGIMTGDEDTDGANTDEKKTQNAPQIKPEAIKSKIMFLLEKLGIDKGTQVDIKTEIKKLTGIAASEKSEDLQEIKSRLEVLVKEKNESHSL